MNNFFLYSEYKQVQRTTVFNTFNVQCSIGPLIVGIIYFCVLSSVAYRVNVHFISFFMFYLSIEYTRFCDNFSAFINNKNTLSLSWVFFFLFHLSICNFSISQIRWQNNISQFIGITSRLLFLFSFVNVLLFPLVWFQVFKFICKIHSNKNRYYDGSLYPVQVKSFIEYSPSVKSYWSR